jgi:hypothetical protein
MILSLLSRIQLLSQTQWNQVQFLLTLTQSLRETLPHPTRARRLILVLTLWDRLELKLLVLILVLNPRLVCTYSPLTCKVLRYWIVRHTTLRHLLLYQLLVQFL